MKPAFKIPVVVILITMLSAGCALLDKLTHFTIKQSKSFIIPQGVPAGIPYDVTTPFFATNSQQYFDENNTNSDMLESAKLSSLIAVLPQGSAEDFSFIESIRIYLIGRNHPATQVAFKYNIAGNAGDTLTFDLLDVELKNYIEEDSLAFKVQLNTDRVNNAQLEPKVNAAFLIDAKILGI